MGLIKEEDETARKDWELLEEGVLADAERRKAVTNKMAEPLVEILRWGLFEEPGISWAASWSALQSYLKSRPALHDSMVNTSALYVQDNFRAEDFSVVSKEREPEMSKIESRDTPENSEPKTPESLPGDLITVPVAQPAMASTVADEPPATEPLEEHEPDAHEPDDVGEQSIGHKTEPSLEPTINQEIEQTPEQPDTTPSLANQWKYISVPEGPDKHEESYHMVGKSPEGLKIIGARVRGKKHKHEGTNCDDWFEFRNSGLWTIIAVSDGAGSKVFSRIGAKESCRAAAASLSEALADHRLRSREHWSNETFKRNKQTGEFAADDLELVQRSLHEAMKKAFDTVEAKALELADSPDHEAILKRKPVLDDLSGTLLLAVHTTVFHEGAERSFVLTCQIGDGMLAAVSVNGGLQLLGLPDSGEFAGQTEFLTSRKKVEKANLTGKTFPFFGRMQALMVMTDGVADDYFPNDPGMLGLYGDLAINGILRVRVKNWQTLIDSSLAQTRLSNTQGVADARLAYPVEVVTADGPRQVFVRSVETYADKLGLPIEELVKSTPLLIAGTMSEPGEELCPEKESEKRLAVWLDSYQIRGSFDDRTLVVLYREVAA